MITLTYPYVSPTNTYIIKRPEFNNKERDSFNKIIRETRGGTLKIGRESTWPKTQSLEVAFPILCPDDSNSLFTFLQVSLGKEIGLLDYLSRITGSCNIDGNQVTRICGPSFSSISGDLTINGTVYASYTVNNPNKITLPSSAGIVNNAKYENQKRQWKGIITNPQDKVTYQNRQSNFTIQFQGVLV